MITINEMQVIEHLIDIIQTSLEELNEAKQLYGENGFCTGQIYAYVECLEVLQLCPTIRLYFLNYDIEKRYSIK